MSKFDYDVSKNIAAHGFPFYALVMAAMRQADTGNAILLAQAFPDIDAEFRARYNAPGGVLPTDRVIA
jgi:hypothetical protein